MRLRSLVLAATLTGLGCQTPATPPTDAGASDGGASSAPLPCGGGGTRLELVRGQIAAVACGVAATSGPIDSVTVAAPPAGLTFGYEPEVPGGMARTLGNLRVTVSDDAPLGESLIDVTTRGPGGEASAVLNVTIVEPTGTGIVVGVGAAEVALHGGDARTVPVRVVSYGGYAGDVVLWGAGPEWDTRALGASFAAASGSVSPGVPFDTVLTLTARYHEFGTGETVVVHAASGRHDDTAEFGFTLDPTPGVVDVWTTLTRGPLVARAGETASAMFDVFSAGDGSGLAFDVSAPSGWTGSIVPGAAVNHALEVTASASTPEGGADVGVTASSGAARWTGTVRVVRPPVSGAWRLATDGPIGASSTETLDDGSELRRVIDPPGRSVDSGGITWSALPGGTSVTVLRGGGPFSTLDAGGRSVLETAIVMPADDHPYVIAATSTAVLAWRFQDFGVLMNTWDMLPVLDANDGHEVRPLAVAYRGGQLLVVFGQETPTMTSGGPSSIVAYVWDGSTWRGSLFVLGSVWRTTGTSGPQLAAAFDSAGVPLVAWIDAADGATHVARITTTVGAPVLASIPPSTGRVALGVDLVVRPDDRALVLVHEGSDLFAAAHPGVGASARLRVLAEDASWTELEDVTLPDAQSAPRVALLGLGASAAARVVYTDASGTYVADPR